jgi:hypothetical protein
VGNTVWLVVEDAESGSIGRDNSILLALHKELDALAGRLGVTRPSAFFDYSTLEEEVGGAPAPQPVWSDSSQGLRTVDALLSELRARPESLGFVPNARRQHWPAELLEDLAHCSAGLQAAASRGLRFSFRVVP